MDRRQLLATMGLAVAAPIGGCLDTTSGQTEDPPERPWDASDPIDEEDGEHHLFVENHTDATERAWLRVVREDGEHVVDGRYELPDGRGIEFEDIAAWETTYSIELALEQGTVHSQEWETPECGSASESPGSGGSRNATLRFETTGDSGDGPLVSIRVDQCDAIVGPDLPATPAEDRRVDE